MADYIRFDKTSKDDVTVGKLYEVYTDDAGYYRFKDDIGDERSIKRQSALNSFMIISLQKKNAAEYNSVLFADPDEQVEDDGYDLSEYADEDEYACEHEPTDGGEPSYVVFAFNDGEEVVFHDLLRVDIVDGEYATAAKVEAQDGATHVVMMANVRYMTMMGMR